MARVWDSDEFMDAWWAWMAIGMVAAFVAGYGCATAAVVLAVTLLIIAIFCFFQARRLHAQEVADVRARARAAARFRP